MNTLENIKEVIAGLTPHERASLIDWVRTAPEGSRVAESVATYLDNSVPDIYTVDQYLTLEASASERHEYVAGRIYAMTGASEAHNSIAGNVFASFHSKLKGGPSRSDPVRSSGRLATTGLHFVHAIRRLSVGGQFNGFGGRVRRRSLLIAAYGACSIRPIG